MTTLQTVKVRCGACGKRSEITLVASTNQFGPPDLDQRPPEMARSTMPYWVYRCPRCGFCASRLEEGNPRLRDYLRSEEYQSQLSDSEVPRLAATFLCVSLLEARQGRLANAAWALIHAAWVCDDADREVQSRACRVRAADMVVRAEAAGQSVRSQPEEVWLVQIDLLRRAGRMTDAREIAEQKRKLFAEGPARQVLDYQRELILRKDTRCHSMDEALPSHDGASGIRQAAVKRR